jgi:hypothetical protein
MLDLAAAAEVFGAYAFVKTPDVEIAGVLGLSASRFTFDLAATTVEATPRAFINSSSTTLPLPLVGASLDWYAAPRLLLGTSLTGLKAKIGDAAWQLTSRTRDNRWSVTEFQ